MPISIANVTREGLVNSVTSALLDNNIAAAFGLNSSNDNLMQFHNRFGTNSVFLPDKKTFTIRTCNFFSVGFSFLPSNSKVLNLFSMALMNKTPEDLKYFIQEVNLPDFKSYGNNEIGTNFMISSLAGHLVVPSSRTIDISFLNTEFSLHEHCFYYWLKETTTNRWIYTSIKEDIEMHNVRPFTKADILVSFTSQKDNSPLHSIILTDCFPIQIMSSTVNQNMSDKNVSRKVQFAFNNMYVTSPFVGENWEKKLKSNPIEDTFNSFIGNDISNGINTVTGGISNAFSNSGLGNLINRQ